MKIIIKNALHDPITPESGVQFYTGNFVGPDSGRKKIHGGSGDTGKGDGYGPGCELHAPIHSSVMCI